jgi:hypothetical protein
MSLHRLTGSRTLDHPVLVVALDGWIDAGFGVAKAVASVLEPERSVELARFDPDQLVDYRSRRPTMTVRDGVNAGVDWPAPRLLASTDPVGNDILWLVGPEPDLAWQRFGEELASLAVSLGVRLSVGLGAFPAPVPHTRPVRLVATATTADLAAQVGYLSGEIIVPTGIEGAIEPALAEAGVPAVGLWARVPHYAAAMAFVPASATLVHGLNAIAKVALDTSRLDQEADETLTRLSTAIAQSPEHQAMVSALESQLDAVERGPDDIGAFGQRLPSGDEIAAELERFLRGETGGEH